MKKILNTENYSEFVEVTDREFDMLLLLELIFSPNGIIWLYDNKLALEAVLRDMRGQN